MVGIWYASYLEESLQPPDLENTLPNQDHQLEHAPPLHSRIGTLGSISMRTLADNDVGLLVFHMGNLVGQLAHCVVMQLAAGQPLKKTQ